MESGRGIVVMLYKELTRISRVSSFLLSANRLLRLFLTDGLHHAGQTGLDDAAGHGQIQADVPGGVAHEQAVAALQQHARLVGEEVRQVGGLRQALAQAGMMLGVTHSCS